MANTSDLSHHSAVVRFGVFELDYVEHQLRKAGHTVRLQNKPFEFLCALVEVPGHVVPREELRKRIWPAESFGSFDDGLNTAARKVREALGDTATSPRFIETVPGVGYRFIAPIAQLQPLIGGPTSPVQHQSESLPVQSLRHSPLRPSWVGPWSLAVALLIAGIVGAFVMLRPNYREGGNVVRLNVSPPPGTRFPPTGPQAALSPSGDRIAFLAISGDDDLRRVWVHSFSSGRAVPLSGSEFAFNPFWSADGSSIAFTSYWRLHTVSLVDGEQRDLGPAQDDAGGSWNEHGDILLGNSPGGIERVSPLTGARTRITVPDTSIGEIGHTFPQFLPGGREFIYLAVARDRSQSAVYQASLDDPERHRILTSRHHALFVKPNWLVFPRDRNLVWQSFDPERRLLGEPVLSDANTVRTLDENGEAGFAVSANGALAYWPPEPAPLRELVWFERSGRRLGTVGQPEMWRNIELSDDDRWLLVERIDPKEGAPNLWVIDLARSTPTQLTFSAANDEIGVWAPSSLNFAYARHRAIHDIADIYVGDREDQSRERSLFVSDGSDHPSDWSHDAKWILFDREDTLGHSNVWRVALAQGKATQYLSGRHDERRARFSPDSRWVAYESNESGRYEIYVRQFPEGTGRIRLSLGGGAQPRWGADGKEIFFISPDLKLMAAEVHARPDTLQAASPRAVLDLRRWVHVPYPQVSYAVSSDGQRFLVSARLNPPGTQQLTVVLNADRAAGLARGRQSATNLH